MTAAQTPGETNALAEYMSSRAELAHLIADVESHMPADVEPEPVVEPVPHVEHETRVEREARARREARAEQLRAAPQPIPGELQVAPQTMFEPEPQLEPELLVESVPAVAPAAQAEPEPVVEPEPKVALVVESEPEPPLDAAPAAEADPAELLARNTLVLTQAVEEVARASELIARACELFAERVESDRLERRTLADAVMTLAQQAASPSPSTPRLLGGSVFATPAWKHEDEIVIDDDRPERSDRSDAQGSTPAERPGSGPTRTAPAVPRQSTWSGGS